MGMDLENILTRRSNILRELANLNSSASGGRPNIRSNLGGVVDHVGYRRSLYEELKELDDLIRKLEGPYEHDMRLVT